MHDLKVLHFCVPKHCNTRESLMPPESVWFWYYFVPFLFLRYFPELPIIVTLFIVFLQYYLCFKKINLCYIIYGSLLLRVRIGKWSFTFVLVQLVKKNRVLINFVILPIFDEESYALTSGHFLIPKISSFTFALEFDTKSFFRRWLIIIYIPYKL